MTIGHYSKSRKCVSVAKPFVMTGNHSDREIMCLFGLVKTSLTIFSPSFRQFGDCCFLLVIFFDVIPSVYISGAGV